jgi:tetratricopeptide (TPR) repeat protein
VSAEKDRDDDIERLLHSGDGERRVVKSLRTVGQFVAAGLILFWAKDVGIPTITQSEPWCRVWAQPPAPRLLGTDISIAVARFVKNLDNDEADRVVEWLRYALEKRSGGTIQVLRTCGKFQLDRADDRSAAHREMQKLGADFLVSPEALLRGRKYLLRSISHDKEEEAAGFEIEIGEDKVFSTEALEGVGRLVAALAVKKSKEAVDARAGYELIGRIAATEIASGQEAKCVIELARGVIAQRLSESSPATSGRGDDLRSFESAVEHFNSAMKVCRRDEDLATLLSKLSKTLTALGDRYVLFGDPVKGMDMYRTALSHSVKYFQDESRRHRNPIKWARARSHQGSANRKLGVELAKKGKHSEAVIAFVNAEKAYEDAEGVYSARSMTHRAEEIQTFLRAVRHLKKQSQAALKRPVRKRGRLSQQASGNALAMMRCGVFVPNPAAVPEACRWHLEGQWPAYSMGGGASGRTSW